MAEPMHDDDRFGGTMVAEPGPAEQVGSGGRALGDDAFEDHDVELDDEEEEPPVRASRRRPKRSAAAEQNGHASARGPALQGMNGRYALAEREVLRVGDVVSGKYRVDRIIGRRGSATVLQGTHIELGQQVTIRHPSRDVSRRPNVTARFLRVSRAACQIQSEHAARILDVGRLDTGVPFLVTEGLNGWELEEVIRVRGPLPVEDAVDYVVQACEAIAEAHRLGLVHRSLSLSNLVLTRRADGSALVKVLEFGVPDVLQAIPFSEIAGTETDANPFLSALRFLSPEQIRNADEVDSRADVWAIGVILHELVTGTSAFYGASPGALLAAVAADPPSATGAVLNGIPPEIESVIARSLVKDRNARIQSISEFVLALRSFAPADSVRVVERISRMALPSRPPPLPGSIAAPSAPAPAPASVGPASRIPHSAIPHGAIPHSAIPHSAIPHSAIPHSAIPHSLPIATKPSAFAPSPWLVTVGVSGAFIGAILAVGTERFRAPNQPTNSPITERAAAPEPTTKPAPVAVARQAAPQEAQAASSAVVPSPTAALALQPRPGAKASAPIAPGPVSLATRDQAPASAKSTTTPAATGSAAAKGGVAASAPQAKKDLFDDTR